MTWINGGALLAIILSVIGYTIYEPIGAISWNPPSPLPTLQFNDILSQYGERLFDGRMLGAESLSFYDGYIYTGLMHGEIVRFKHEEGQIPQTYESVLWFNESCKNLKQIFIYEEYDPLREPLCGRPLGMRIDSEGNMFIAESYSGILEYNIRTKKLRRLSSSSKLANDLDYFEDEIYFTESSQRWGRNKIIFEIFSAQMSGKVLRLNRNTLKLETLVENIPLTNGLTLSHDRSKIFFVSGPAIHRIDRASGKYEGIVLDNLPCLPDNIRRNADGKTYLLTSGSKRSQPFALGDALSAYPMIRELIALGTLYSQNRLIKLIPVHGGVYQLDLDASETRIVSSIQDSKAKFGWLSESEKVGNFLYIGSWRENFITRIPWEKTRFGQLK